MCKKRILFVINNLNCGGAEKALVSLLKILDYSKYEVDLFLFQKEGIFLNQVPDSVNILPTPGNYRYFDMPLKTVIVENLKRLNFKVIVNRILFGAVYKKEELSVIAEQKAWKYIKPTIKPLEKEYDLAIGYLEKTPVYFCVDKVRAKKRIGFIHNDFVKLQMDSSLEIPFFKKLNYIITVSEHCKIVLDKVFKNFTDKISVMHNIVSKNTINELANDVVVNIEANDSVFLSVGRLNRQKGYDLAIEACKILKEKGVKFKWYVLGEGGERDFLQNMIKEYGLEEEFILYGNVENPYPYIKRADLIVQTSRFEGKSVVLDESKILAKPIVVTNYATVKDQITHLQDGYIVEMDAESIAQGIQKMLNDKKIVSKITKNLKGEDYGTEFEIEKLYSLIR